MNSKNNASYFKIGTIVPTIAKFYPKTWIFHVVMTWIILMIGSIFEIIYSIDYLVAISLLFYILFIIFFNIIYFNFSIIEANEYQYHNINYRDLVISIAVFGNYIFDYIIWISSKKRQTFRLIRSLGGPVALGWPDPDSVGSPKISRKDVVSQLEVDARAASNWDEAR